MASGSEERTSPGVLARAFLCIRTGACGRLIWGAESNPKPAHKPREGNGEPASKPDSEKF